MERQILCPHCGSSMNEDILKQKNSENVCLVCGESLLTSEDSTSPDQPLSFGEGIELGENDSFDEDKIDFWWYEIREPRTLGESDRGDVGITCTKCGHLSGAPYPVAKTGDYLLIDSRFCGRCSCGIEMKNHILSKRPADWVDTRRLDMWKRDENVPIIKCPICSSTKVHKISLTNKAASAIAFGVLAAGHVSKTYKCDICGSKF